MMRVYVNNVMELAYYSPFNIASVLSLPAHSPLLMGVTASTSE